MNIGIVSPGAMGASVGAAAVSNGHHVFWSGDGRSPDSHQRARSAGFEDCGSLQQLVDVSDIVLSICPPHDAETIANDISELNFQGIYVDCNAISPAKTITLSMLHSNFVDGGIIGGPAWDKSDGTCLYLSGDKADEIAELFTDTPLNAKKVSAIIGEASALKMAFAAYTKGTTALLAAILAMADQHNVRHALEAQWGESFASATHNRLLANSSKAWRFAGEMREIASTFENVGLPGGFHTAAAELFESMSDYKDQPAETIEQLLETLSSR